MPLIVENVRGAEDWVGRARYHFGSFYLWGDVPPLMPRAGHGKRFDERPLNLAAHQERGVKHPGMNWSDRDNPERMFNSIKVPRETGRRTTPNNGARVTSRDCGVEAQKQPVWFNDDKRKATKCGGDWFGSGEDCSLMRRMSSKSSARKAASAQIAKIPFPLSSHIARVFKRN